jgi:hypothetical protein
MVAAPEFHPGDIASSMRATSSMRAAILRDARGQSPRAPQDEGCRLMKGCTATNSDLILRSLGSQGQGVSKDGRTRHQWRKASCITGDVVMRGTSSMSSKLKSRDVGAAQPAIMQARRHERAGDAELLQRRQIARVAYTAGRIN